MVREIEFHLSVPDFAEEIECPFSRQIRSLCGFIERELKEQKIVSNYKGLIVIGTKNAKPECNLNVINRKYIDISIPFPEKQYNKLGLLKLNRHLMDDALTARKLYATSIDLDIDHNYKVFPAEDFEKILVHEVQEFFIGLLLEAIEICGQEYEIPVDVIEVAITKFREADYKNEWIFKRKKLPGSNLKCIFSCEWTIAYFSMVMEVYNKSEKVLSEKVMYTLPSEYSFATRYDKVQFLDSKVVVLDRYGDPTYERDLSEFI